MAHRWHTFSSHEWHFAELHGSLENKKAASEISESRFLMGFCLLTEAFIFGASGIMGTEKDQIKLCLQTSNEWYLQKINGDAAK